MSRVAALSGHDLIASWWSPAAYLWQDAATVLVYGAIDVALRRAPRVAWTVYATFVAYVALGVPVTRVMSTPMTLTMWRAAGSALSDSMWMYVTPANVLWIASVAAVAVVMPYVAFGFRRTFDRRVAKSPPKGGRHVRVFAQSPPEGGHYVRVVALSPEGGHYVRIATFCLVALTAFGPTAVERVDTHGLDRNAWSALVLSALPRATAAAMKEPPDARQDWRRGLHAEPPTDDLSRFRGAAANRNVILVSLESTAAQYLSLYGADDDVMPNLSALARSAIVFDNAYTVYPESIKGLFSILCSLYPAFDRAVDGYADGPCRSVASHLADRGFHSALFHSGRFAYLGMDAVVRNRGFDLLADAGDIGGDHKSSFGVDDRTTVARALTWIDTLPRGDRFFLTFLPIAGHHPYESPGSGPFPARDEFGRYRNALRYGDTALADLTQGIAARGLDEQTLWIVLGDHGEAFGQHDGNFGHTFQLYEENVRVPFLIAAPGLIPRQSHTRRVVSLIDTAPTILDLLGLPEDDAYQGTSALSSGPLMALFFADYSLGLLGCATDASSTSTSSSRGVRACSMLIAIRWKRTTSQPSALRTRDGTLRRCVSGPRPRTRGSEPHQSIDLDDERAVLETAHQRRDRELNRPPSRSSLPNRGEPVF